jgi:hypothetical protein
MRTLKRLPLYLWSSPTTLVGLLLVLPVLLSGGRAQVVDGVLELYGGFASFLLRRCTLLRYGASAMTLGHVVLGRDEKLLELTRAHERIHVRQCERWGPLFIPAYVLSSLVLWMCRRNPYRDNPFEREAYRAVP